MCVCVWVCTRARGCVWVCVGVYVCVYVCVWVWVWVGVGVGGCGCVCVSVPQTLGVLYIISHIFFVNDAADQGSFSQHFFFIAH
jgi:hypothetical protein